MKIHRARLQGLLLVELDVHADERGSFREVFHAVKLQSEEELASFRPVQMNVSHNVRGVIRGVHAEPWEKLVHVPHGEVYAPIVDLRKQSPTFGEYDAFRLDAGHALFIPRGFGNAFQATSDLAVYTYLVNEHWNPAMRYPAVAYDDPDVEITWPIVGGEEIVSTKDRANPSFAEFAARA